MGLNSGLEKILINLGKDNKPTFVAVGVAAAKGIFRPIFTMADKKQDKESKKYTAIREGLTEAIAIPVYWGSGELASYIAKKMSKPKDMTSDVYKKVIEGHQFDSQDMALQAKNIRKNLFKTRTTLSMLGVFLSALLIIPAICSLSIKPIMNIIQKNKKITPQNNTQENVKNIKIKQNTFKQRNIINPYHNNLYNNMMKVGGV